MVSSIRCLVSLVVVVGCASTTPVKKVGGIPVCGREDAPIFSRTMIMHSVPDPACSPSDERECERETVPRAGARYVIWEVTAGGEPIAQLREGVSDENGMILEGCLPDVHLGVEVDGHVEILGVEYEEEVEEVVRGEVRSFIMR